MTERSSSPDFCDLELAPLAELSGVEQFANVLFSSAKQRAGVAHPLENRRPEPDAPGL